MQFGMPTLVENHTLEENIKLAEMRKLTASLCLFFKSLFIIISPSFH